VHHFENLRQHYQHKKKLHRLFKSIDKRLPTCELFKLFHFLKSSLNSPNPALGLVGGTMYLPKHFSQNDELKVKKLIEKNSFATILSYPKNEKPFINHLPIMFSSQAGEEKILIGHMAKKNPQWQHFRENPQSTIIISGGNTYITPKWYKSGRDVPTWNYAVAHLHGKMELIESFNEQVEILKQLSHFFESPSLQPWAFELPDDFQAESTLTSAIISFKFHTEKIETKFKLSQNHSAEDRQGVIDGLLERKDDMSKLVREMMLENENNKIWQPPTIETSRLILRPIQLADAESIFDYAKNPNVCKYTLWETHQSVADSLSYIKDYIFDYYSKGVPEPLGIALKENPQKVIGTVGCYWTSKQAKAMELGYAISEDYWGKGLVAEASQAMMDYCFKEFSLKRIQARCKVENKPSARVMEKVGMIHEGTLKSAIFHRNRFWDMHYFAKVVE